MTPKAMKLDLYLWYVFDLQKGFLFNFDNIFIETSVMECIYSPEEFAYLNRTKRLLEFQVMFYFLFTKNLRITLLFFLYTHLLHLTMVQKEASYFHFRSCIKV